MNNQNFGSTNTQSSNQSNGSGSAAASTPSQTVTPNREISLIAIGKLTVWAGNTRDTKMAGEAAIVSLKDSIKVNGQQVPVIVRKMGANEFEIIAGARRFAAIVSLNADGIELDVLAEVRSINDDDAYKLVIGENASRHGFVALETARFYKHAIDDRYKTNVELAAALGLDKATIGRTLNILNLPDSVKRKIIDPRAISVAQATRFMTDWNNSYLRPRLMAAIDELAKASAAEVFGTLREIAHPRSEEADLLVDGVTLGFLKVAKGVTTIMLNTAANGVEAAAIGAVITARLTAIRTSAD